MQVSTQPQSKLIRWKFLLIFRIKEFHPVNIWTLSNKVYIVNPLILLHAISDYKKRLYKKRLVVFVDIKKRRLVRISHAKKRNILQYFQNALSRE